MIVRGSARLLSFLVCGLVAMVVVTTADERDAFAAQPIDVTAVGCPTLDRREIERLLSIELGSVSRQWQESVASEPLHVELSCQGTRMAVSIADRLTGKRLSRDVEINPTAPDRDRTAALLVSELLLGSWSELLRSPQAPPPAPLPPIPQAAAEPPPPPPNRGLRGAVDLVAGARLRALDHPVVSGDLALRLELIAARHARFFVTGGYERGASSTTVGTVDFGLASAGLGVGWRSSRLGTGGRLVVDLAATGSAAYVDLSGSAPAGSNGAVIGSSTSGAVAELALQGGPSLVLGPARIGLELTAGWTVSPVTGHVVAVADSASAATVRDVSLGGIWLGASLVFSTVEAGL
jgi:hypothetical protein